MSSKAAVSAANQAVSFKKYTVPYTRFGSFINRIFSVVPGRSTGVPLNPQFRNPPPGALDPNTYDDPVTIPAADLAENPYWKRDVRRRYPRLSTVTQGDVVALLSVGSQGNEKVELIGDAGSKQLVAVKEEGSKGLAAFLTKEKNLSQNVLGPDSFPPTPTPLHVRTQTGEKRYELLDDQSYSPDYQCRNFQ